MRDLINAPLEILMELKSPDHIETSRELHEKKDQILPGLQKIADEGNDANIRVLVQALFETGFLSTKNINHSEKVLSELIYGAKAHEAIDTFLDLFEKLRGEGYTSLDRSEMYNSSGDNYSAAFEYNIKPSESEIKIHNGTSKVLGVEKTELRSDIKRKVIYLEGQSPAHAIILNYSVFSNTPQNLIVVNLKDEYNDPDLLPELDKKEFDIEKDYEYSAYNLKKTGRIITILDIDRMSCEPVYEAHEINRALDNLYCSHFALLEDLQNA